MTNDKHNDNNEQNVRMILVLFSYLCVHIPFLNFSMFFIDKKIDIPIVEYQHGNWSEDGQNISNKVGNAG